MMTRLIDGRQLARYVQHLDERYTVTGATLDGMGFDDTLDGIGTDTINESPFDDIEGAYVGYDDTAIIDDDDTIDTPHFERPVVFALDNPGHKVKYKCTPCRTLVRRVPGMVMACTC